MHLSVILATFAILPSALGQLNTLAKAKGFKYFGSATDNSEITDSTYTAILSNTSQFGQITPANTQKWVYIEPQQNVYSYTQGDAITNFAEKNGQMLRCHNLVWYNELPSWGKSVMLYLQMVIEIDCEIVTGGSWTNATLIAALKAQ